MGDEVVIDILSVIGKGIESEVRTRLPACTQRPSDVGILFRELPGVIVLSKEVISLYDIESIEHCIPPRWELLTRFDSKPSESYEEDHWQSEGHRKLLEFQQNDVDRWEPRTQDPCEQETSTDCECPTNHNEPSFSMGAIDTLLMSV